MPHGIKNSATGALSAEGKPLSLSSAGGQSALAANDSIPAGIQQLPRDVGWMLFGVGFAGFVAPGIFGLPFMVAGGMILWPKTANRLQGLLAKDSPQKTMAPGMKQIIRFLDDLERRYPSSGKP